MSIAYPIRKVTVEAVCGIDCRVVAVGSVWETGILLFRHPENPDRFLPTLKKWARSSDEEGRTYIIWEADHPKMKGLVIQPIHSQYCYAVSPKCSPFCGVGISIENVDPLPGSEST